VATRLERIARAEQIIRGTPTITKRRLQARLKAEFGIGLADSTRRRLLQNANTAAFLWARLNTPAFTRYDRIVLRSILRRTGSTPYLAEAINNRFVAAKNARDAGISRRDFFRQVKRYAKERGYIADKTTRTKDRPDGTVKGQIDWWKVLRDLRDREIDRGEYVPKPRPKPKTDKGNIKAQKARYQDKMSTKAHARWVERERSRLKLG